MPQTLFTNCSLNTSQSVFLENSGYVPFEIWLILLIIAFICLFSSMWLNLEKCPDLTAALSSVLFGILSICTAFVEFWTYEIVQVSAGNSNITNVVVVPIVRTFPSWWLVLFMLLMFVLSIINVYRIHALQLVQATSKMKV